MNPTVVDDPGNEHARAKLRELLGEGKAVAFVGAGASAGMYPLWNQLITRNYSRTIYSRTPGACTQAGVKSHQQRADCPPPPKKIDGRESR